MLFVQLRYCVSVRAHAIYNTWLSTQIQLRGRAGGNPASGPEDSTLIKIPLIEPGWGDDSTRLKAEEKVRDLIAPISELGPIVASDFLVVCVHKPFPLLN